MFLVLLFFFFLFFSFFFFLFCSAMGASDETVHVAFRAFQGDEFRREVVAVNGSLASVANRTQLPLVTSAEQADCAGVLALE